MIFLFPRWDMLIPWRVQVGGGSSKVLDDFYKASWNYGSDGDCQIFGGNSGIQNPKWIHPRNLV